jgi:hypothetical protein
MGIKGFTAWFRKQFPSAYVPRLKQYDHVYIDVAPMLYLASKGACSCTSRRLTAHMALQAQRSLRRWPIRGSDKSC